MQLRQINFSDKHSAFQKHISSNTTASHRLTTSLALKSSAFKTDPFAQHVESYPISTTWNGVTLKIEAKQTGLGLNFVFRIPWVHGWHCFLQQANVIHKVGLAESSSKIPVISECKVNLHPKVNYITTTNQIKQHEMMNMMIFFTYLVEEAS